MEKESPFLPLPEKTLESIKTIDDTIKTIPNKYFNYGTAGFRFNEDLLEKISFRSSILTCLLSMSKNSLPYGIMLTASHNTYTDNGVKIAGLNGEMINHDEEILMEEIANSKNLIETIKSIVDKLKIKQHRCIVILGNDTRRSNKKLSEIMIKGFKCFDSCEYNFYNVITTPALHFLTKVSQMAFEKIGIKNKMIFPPENDYWNFLGGTYQGFNEYYDKYFKKEECKKYNKELVIDCANGLSGYCKDKINEVLQKGNKDLKVYFINVDYLAYEKLNNNCGAEFTHKERKYPLNKVEQYPNVIKNLSFDGDVDRIIYYIYNKDINENIKLIDGDRLIVLYSTILNYFIKLLSPNLQNKFYENINIGIITTAYANGSLMKYIEEKLKGLKLDLAKTGVKYLHLKARNYDIAVYFEANGHGTIYCNEKLIEKFNLLNSLIENSKDSQILELIQKYISMFNPSIDDSISSLIATESALKVLDYSIEDVYLMYKELPALNTKVSVKDKNIFKTNDNETRLVEPENVQKIIDEVVAKCKNGRAFIRPSGTEDVVRIYAEAESIEEAKEITNHLVEALKNY